MKFVENIGVDGGSALGRGGYRPPAHGPFTPSRALLASVAHLDFLMRENCAIWLQIGCGSFPIKTNRAVVMPFKINVLCLCPDPTSAKKMAAVRILTGKALTRG